MIVILNEDCIDKRDDYLYEEMVLDTRDWYLRSYGNVYILRSLRNHDLEYRLTKYGYTLVKDAMVRGNH